MVYKQSRQLNSVNDKGEKFLKKLQSMMNELDDEVNAHRNRKGTVGNINQLENIRKELEIMSNTLSFKKFKPSYTRIIVDSWDYTNPLGAKLLDLYDDYLKL
jgi:hypothetical protein